MKRELYEKPVLDELVLESNNTICACTVQKLNAFDQSCGLSEELTEMLALGGIGEGSICFGDTEGCVLEITGYCYFTSTDMTFSS